MKVSIDRTVTPPVIVVSGLQTIDTRLSFSLELKETHELYMGIENILFGGGLTIEEEVHLVNEQ